jgi:chemotaxis protein MotB
MARPVNFLLVAPLCAALIGGCSGGDMATQLAQTEAANRQLQAENASLQAQLAQQQSQPQQNTYTVAADLLFPPGSFDITQNGQAALNDIIGKLKSVRNAKIVVYGYTDSQKPGKSLTAQGIKTNLDLSSRRADTVADYLKANGIDPNILSTKGRGDTHPAGDNKTEAGRAQNRRIEIVVEGPGS